MVQRLKCIYLAASTLDETENIAKDLEIKIQTNCIVPEDFC